MAKNLAIVSEHLKNRFYLSPVVVIIFSLLAFRGRLAPVALIGAVPVVVTCGIYLFFYFQVSYLTMLSYGVPLLIACGIANVSHLFLPQKPGWAWLSIVTFIVPIFYLEKTIIAAYPPRITTQERYGEAEDSQSSSTAFSLTLLLWRCTAYCSSIMK